MMPPTKRGPKEEQQTLHPVTKNCVVVRRAGLFAGILLLVMMTVVFSPVLAQSLPVPSGGSGNFNQGIPVYWPYHALLMVTGFILLFAGFITAKFHKKGKWYRTHVILQIAGCTFVIIGMFIAVYMVALSGFSHLRNLHEILGGVIVVLILITIAVGYLIRRVDASKNTIRTGHRWLGRISLTLVAVNIVLGLMVLALVLRR